MCGKSGQDHFENGLVIVSLFSAVQIFMLVIFQRHTHSSNIHKSQAMIQSHSTRIYHEYIYNQIKLLIKQSLSNNISRITDLSISSYPH